MDSTIQNLTRDHPQYEERLNYIRQCSGSQLRQECALVIPDEMMPYDFIDSLGTCNESDIALRACLMCWTVTSTHIVPREMQLRAVLADRMGQNSLISAGTGSGKTLPIALNILLDDPEEKAVSITISPLKRLQVTQDSDLNTKLGIHSLPINEDTPRQDSWWLENIYPQTNGKPRLQHLIVTVEQLFKTPEGHMPRLGKILRDPRHPFRKRVARINVDEAHFIYTAGQALYGSTPFRPAWGQLEDLKRHLPRDVRWHLYSATFPKHILTCIESTMLGADYEFIHVTSNRPNIIYATHQVDTSIGKLENYECFLTFPFDLETQPRVIIFVDNKDLACAIQDHLDFCLPRALQETGIVMYYHSSMSPSYLEGTHNDFVSATGRCRILVATSGESVGVDFPDVKIVCAAGLPSNVVDALQRGGRALRAGCGHAVFVIFYEAWAHDISQEEYTANSAKYSNDPDRPRQDITKFSKSRERAPLSLISIIQSTRCLRQLFSEYLNDRTTSALLYSGPFCCDRHGDGFDINEHLPRRLYVAPGNKRKDPQDSPDIGDDGEDKENENALAGGAAIGNERPSNSKDSKLKLRAKADRLELDPKLVAWLRHELETNNPYQRPFQQILSHENRKTLVRLSPQDIVSADTIVNALNESQEWAKQHGQSLFNVVQEHNRTSEVAKKAIKLATKAAKAAQNPRVAFSADAFVVTTADSFAAGGCGDNFLRGGGPLTTTQPSVRSPQANVIADDLYRAEGSHAAQRKRQKSQK